MLFIEAGNIFLGRIFRKGLKIIGKSAKKKNVKRF